MKKILVITGGSRGIGLATAQRFAHEGYMVVNLSRSKPPLEAIHHFNADLGDSLWPDCVAAPLTALLRDAQHICLVHCAAKLAKDAIDSVSAQQWQQVLQLNLIAASQLNQLVLPMMKPGSSILYVNSTLGEKAVANSCSYVTSKHAQLGLMKATCQDLMGRGIHTAAICPGFTDTEMLRSLAANNPELLEQFAQQSSFKRLLDPQEIADSLWFCAQSPAINGAIIHANLGQLEH